MWVWILIRVRCTTLCDKVCQWLATGQWFSQGPPVSSTNKTDRHHITEILLNVALNTIKQTNLHNFSMVQHYMYAAFTIEVLKCLVTECPIWETTTISYLIFFPVLSKLSRIVSKHIWDLKVCNMNSLHLFYGHLRSIVGSPW